MTLREQIEFTIIERDAYKKANFADPKIINWLDSVVESLVDLETRIENCELL